MHEQETLTRNSPGWAMDRFRSDALPRLLDDLAPVASTGISREQCENIKQTLNKIIDTASTLPDGGVFRKAIFQHLQDYYDLYKEWNEVNGTGPASEQERNKLVRKIRIVRNRIAKATRTNIHILNRELDLKLIDSWYKALRNLVEAAPNLFRSLANAVSRYFTRRGI